MLLLIIIFSCFHLLSCSFSSTEPSLRIRISDVGLNYTDRIGEILLNSQIRATKIPDLTIAINSGPGHGSATVRNTRIISFRPLTYSYTLHPPNALEWDTIGGSISISGDWVAWYKVLFTVWFHGGFTASVNDIRLSASVSAIKDVDEKPAVKLISCNAKIGSVSVRINGGFIPSIINLFSSSIASAVKSSIEGQVCQQAQTVLINILNQKLKSLPANIDLGKNFVLHYALHADPTVGAGYAEGLLDSRIMWKDGTSSPIQCPPLPSDKDASKRMVYVWASDYILNTFLQSAHQHNASRVNVNRFSFPEAGPYLRTTCPGAVCAGSISRTIPDRYPNKYTQSVLFTRSAPTAVVSPDAARLSAELRADLYVEPKSSRNLLVTFDIDFAGQLTVKVVSEGSTGGHRLTGDLVIDQFHIHVNKSNVGYISPIEIDVVVTLAKPFLQKLVNGYLNKGVVVPTIPDVKMINAQVTLMERAVQVDSDVIYKNYTYNF